jgi:hypothetical protein
MHRVSGLRLSLSLGLLLLFASRAYLAVVAAIDVPMCRINLTAPCCCYCAAIAALVVVSVVVAVVVVNGKLKQNM